MTDSDKVTTDKPKNPGRQEWGKKLGKMQKEIKLKKQNELLEQKSDESFTLKWGYGVAATGIIIAAAGIWYYQKKSYDRPIVVETSPIKQKAFPDF
jgi:hypothetical protein